MRAVDPRVSYAEVARWPDDGRRYELYDGEAIVVPAPNFPHVEGLRGGGRARMRRDERIEAVEHLLRDVAPGDDVHFCQQRGLCPTILLDQSDEV